MLGLFLHLSRPQQPLPLWWKLLPALLHGALLLPAHSHAAVPSRAAYPTCGIYFWGIAGSLRQDYFVHGRFPFARRMASRRPCSADALVAFALYAGIYLGRIKALVLSLIFAPDPV